MMRFTGIGQYVPADSPVHRLDPAAKIGIAVLYTAGLFLVDRFVGMFLMAATVAVLTRLACVPARAVTRGLRAVAFIVGFTLVANAVRWEPATALLRLGPLALDGPGLRDGVFFASRIILLVTGTSLLTLTTSPVQLAGGLERALGPLERLRVPVGDLAMTLTIALRFIPTTAEEATGIMTAQQARGARFDAGGPIRRARAYAPVLVPLFFQLFRRADALATAMEARCYRGSGGRTRLVERRMTVPDWAALAAIGGGFLLVGRFL